MTHIFLHFAELHIDSSIRYKHTLVENYIDRKCNKIKRIVIPFNYLLSIVFKVTTKADD